MTRLLSYVEKEFVYLWLLNVFYAIESVEKQVSDRSLINLVLCDNFWRFFMKEYVLGFVFLGNSKILLQEKNRGGIYLENKLNGLGGKIEPTDLTPKRAMCREYLEETGDSRDIEWYEFGKIKYPNAVLHIFFANVDADFYDNIIFTSDDPHAEKLFIFDLNEIDWNMCVSNLRYIIPLIMD